MAGARTRTNPAQRRAPVPRAATIFAVLLATACADHAVVEPRADARDDCGSVCAPMTMTTTAAATIVPPTPVAITPNGTSSTGFPVLTLPAGLDLPIAMNDQHYVLGNGLSPSHGFRSPLVWTGEAEFLDLMPVKAVRQRRKGVRHQ